MKKNKILRAISFVIIVATIICSFASISSACFDFSKLFNCGDVSTSTDITTNTDIATRTDVETPTDIATGTDFSTNTDIGTNTDIEESKCTIIVIIEKIISFIVSLFSFAC